MKKRSCAILFRNQSIGFRLLGFSAAIFLLLSFPAAHAAEKLTISGSSTVKPIVEAAAVAFKKINPDVQIIIGGGGSSGGVKNAGTGATNIGMASRKLKEKEKSQYPDIVAIPIGKDGVSIIANKRNTCDAVSKEQLQDIYTGKITNWKGLGGADTAIELFGILLHHGTSSVFMKYVGLEAEEVGEGASKTIHYWKKGGNKQAHVKAKGVDGNRPSCAAVMTKPGVVSFASIGFAQSLADKGAPIKLIKLEGVEPTSANVVSGEYALSRPLLVITKGKAAGAAAQFIDFLLSADGQKIVEEKGYISVK